MIDVDRLTRVPQEWQGLAESGVTGLSGEDLARVALTARRMRELADHLEVHALGALDRDGFTNLEHGATTAGWFATATGLPHHVVRSQLRASRLLQHELAPTAQAWFEGRITSEHVRVLLDAANPRIRDQIADQQAHLIAKVPGTRFDRWKAEVAERARLLDQDGPEPDDATTTSATWARSDSFAQLQARFGGADAETVEQIVEHKTDELFRQHARDRQHCPELAPLRRPGNDPRSWSATAAAPSPAATARWGGPTSTTSPRGATADPPTSTTSSRSVAATTASPPARVGR